MSMMEPAKERTRAQLQRLKWGMLLVPLLLLALYEAHNVLLDVLVVLGVSFLLVQFAFSIVFRLHDRSMRQQERLDILHQVDAELGASLEQERVLEAVLAGVLRLTSARAARIFAYDPERRAFTAGWECLVAGGCYPTDYHPRPDGFNARIVRTGEPMIIEDATDHPLTPVEGGITLSCCLDNTDAFRPPAMLFSVADTGVGIRPGDQERIFEEFYQADNLPSREIEGTGLGLAISKRLIEMHDGRIWVESESGRGTTFLFVLPLAGPPAPGVDA